MASSQRGELSGSQIVRLAKEISTQAMESFAEGYLEIRDTTIKSLKEQHKNNMEAFNRDLIRTWTYKNPGECQVEVSVTKL